jgi:hypothetical protein
MHVHTWADLGVAGAEELVCVAPSLQTKCLCYLAGTSQVTWFVKDFLAGICKNDMQTWIIQALIL